MRITWAMIFVSVFLMSGCSAFKDQTGEYVTEAVVDHIAEEIDERLDRRGLSLEQLREVADDDGDGSVSMAEVHETAKAAATDLFTAYVAKMELEQRTEWDAATKNLVTRDEQAGLKGDVHDFWNWLKASFGLMVTTIVSYLVKQVFSAKADSKRDVDIAKNKARMDALEKLLHRNLNNDGMIGGAEGERVES
jgi:hypothetical protein